MPLDFAKDKLGTQSAYVYDPSGKKKYMSIEDISEEEGQQIGYVKAKGKRVKVTYSELRGAWLGDILK